MSGSEEERADWRERNRRRKARAENKPADLWGGIVPLEGELPPTGLARRKNHAPGKDNWKGRQR